MKIIPVFLAALLFSSQALAAPSLTLEESLEMALQRHPRLAEARETLAGAEARAGQSLANYYPQISITADWSKGRTFLTPLESIRPTEVHTEGVYLKQTIYDFGRTSGAAEATRMHRDAAHEAVAVTRQEVVLRVSNAYYLLLAAEKQVIATGETLKAREVVFRQAQEFFGQGIRARVDVARAEANLYLARSDLIRAEGVLERAKVELANSMGLESLGERKVQEPTSPPRSLPQRSLLVQEALLNRAELRQLADLKSASSATLRAAKGSYLPVLSGTASVGYAGRDFPPGGNVWGVGVNLTIPLFSGFSSVEQVREASADIGAIAARQQDLRLQIVKEVESAWLAASDSLARVTSTAKAVVAAQESRALAEGRYQEGVGSIIEVTDAQTQSLEAETGHIQAEYDYRIALASLDRAVGKE